MIIPRSVLLKTRHVAGKVAEKIRTFSERLAFYDTGKAREATDDIIRLRKIEALCMEGN
jgi:hypothetical protein